MLWVEALPKELRRNSPLVYSAYLRFSLGTEPSRRASKSPKSVAMRPDRNFTTLLTTTTCSPTLDFVKNYTNYAPGTLTVDFTATTLPLRKHFTHLVVITVKWFANGCAAAIVRLAASRQISAKLSLEKSCVDFGELRSHPVRA